ncbi:hypothetical protein [Oceanobacillus sp. FSL H7-0719]|uniref:hypothetical protein n=1 Tax=Oceanobacillus sp. FSL H7-0719 TaxID=2954507 RepID=UPI00324D08DF
MFKAAVYLVHELIFILVILIGAGPMFSFAAPERDQPFGVWVFLISTIGLISLFILTLQYGALVE